MNEDKEQIEPEKRWNVKIGNYTIEKADVFAALQSLFICVGILLAVMIGRLSMSQEIQVLLDYSCANMNFIIDEETGTIIIRDVVTKQLIDPVEYLNLTTTSTTLQ